MGQELQPTPNWRFCSTTKDNQGIVGIFVSLARASGISSLPHVRIISSVAVPPYPSAAPSPERPLRLAPHVATALVRFAVQVQGTPGPNVLLAVRRESATSEARFWPEFDVLSRSYMGVKMEDIPGSHILFFTFVIRNNRNSSF